jgi:hypothetical protein
MREREKKKLVLFSDKVKFSKCSFFYHHHLSCLIPLPVPLPVLVGDDICLSLQTERAGLQVGLDLERGPAPGLKVIAPVIIALQLPEILKTRMRFPAPLSLESGESIIF